MTNCTEGCNCLVGFNNIGGSRVSSTVNIQWVLYISLATVLLIFCTSLIIMSLSDFYFEIDDDQATALNLYLTLLDDE